MNILTGARFAQARSNDAHARALVGYTEVLAVNKFNAGLARSLLGEVESPKIKKFSKFIDNFAAQTIRRDKKVQGDIRTLDNKVRKVGLRRLVFSTVTTAARGLLRFLMLGARLAGFLARLTSRFMIRGLTSIGRVLLFTAPRLLLFNPVGLAVTAVAAIGVGGYQVYKSKQEKAADVFEAKETGIIPPTSASSEVALSPKQQRVRGLRNNNPGNLDFHGQPGASRETLPNGTPGRFAKFGTQSEGLYALTTQLQRDIGGKNRNAPGVRNTLASLIATYAPAKDNNNVQRYTALLVKATGLQPYDVINPKDPKLMTDLVIGIIIMENGSNPYTRAQIQEAVSRGVSYAERGFKNFEVNLESNKKAVSAKAPAPVKAPAKAPEKPKAVETRQDAPKEAEAKKGSGPLGVQVQGVDDVGPAEGFLIPMSGRFSNGSEKSRTIKSFDGKVKTADHKGIDIAAPTGTPVYAAHTGQVAIARLMRGYGNTVVIKGDDKYYTWYAHLSAFRTKVGERLRRGSLLGLSGGGKGDPGAGTSTGPHLHFGVSTALNNASYVAPEQFFAGLPKESERRDLESKGVKTMLISSVAPDAQTKTAEYTRAGSKIKVLRI
jgi:murein DD-endopeptidase MepM/ murein hydrolase activator NlpD